MANNTNAFGKVNNFDVNGFIESLKLPELAKVLLVSTEDCEFFLKNYYLKNNFLYDDLLDFRDYKIEKSDKTFDSFKKDCYTKNLRQAFEQTFYQTFTVYDIEHITNAIITNRTSLEQLFNAFKENPDKNIMKIVL